MVDALFIAVVLGFFALALAYARGCERLRGGESWLTRCGYLS
jgi:hypothetical protein